MTRGANANSFTQSVSFLAFAARTVLAS